MSIEFPCTQKQILQNNTLTIHPQTSHNILPTQRIRFLSENNDIVPTETQNTLSPYTPDSVLDYDLSFL